MRSHSTIRKITPKIQYYDGFNSDYYSMHTLERHKCQHFRRYTFSISHKEEGHVFCEDFEKENLKYYRRIICIPIGFQFDLKNIIVNLKKANSEFDSPTIEQFKNVTILRASKFNKEKYIFIFEFGVIVLWSFDEDEEIDILEIFYKNCKYLINSKRNHNKINELLEEIKEETNMFYYRKGENFNISHRNKITIESTEVTELLSVAYALAQHSILSHYEDEVAGTIEETKYIPIEMRDKGQISLSKKEISRNIGLIFMRRSAVNLNSDIIDTPDLFWDQRNEMENYYSVIRKFLEIDKRVSVLDRRMKILKELYDVMNNEIKTQGKFRLEWIVVYLIVIEIFVSIFWKMLVKDILKLY